MADNQTFDLCILGKMALCGDDRKCARCGWNALVEAERKSELRHGQVKARERVRLTAARKIVQPDENGWFKTGRALPDEGERVIVTDGAFVGEAYIGQDGSWKRYGVNMVDRSLGIFPPVAWMPMPRYQKINKLVLRGSR